MKIIREGRKPLTEWTLECKQCGCIFVFDNRDVKHDQREGDWVHCPTCRLGIDCTDRKSWGKEVLYENL